MFLVSSDFTIHISVYIALLEDLFFLENFSTSCERNAHFDKISFAIHLGWYKGKTFFFHLSYEIVDIFFLE